jgi:hypothetical protein
MGVWDQIAFSGKTTGVWESGTRLGRKQGDTLPGQQQISWNFTKHHQRRFGRGFYAAINRMPESEYKKIILDLVKKKEKSRGRGEGLTEKQWRYLGLLMTKADPACLRNPRIKLPKREEPKKLSIEEKYIGIRRKK